MTMLMYVTLLEAAAFFDETDFEDTWSTYSDALKTKAIKRATLTIEKIPFYGKKYNREQDFQFPRIRHQGSKICYWDVDKDTNEIVVPERVKKAVMVQAKALLDYKDNRIIKIQRAGITSISIGSSSESYDLTKTLFHPKFNIINEAVDFLQPYILKGF